MIKNEQGRTKVNEKTYINGSQSVNKRKREKDDRGTIKLYSETILFVVSIERTSYMKEIFKSKGMILFIVIFLTTILLGSIGG